MDSAPAIYRLARSHGLHAGYVDYTGQFRGADPDVVAAVLTALGASPHDHDIGAQLLARELARQDAILEPVTVAWDGTGELVVRLPQRMADRKLELVITREDGVRLQHATSAAEGRHLETVELGGARFVAFAVPLQPPGSAALPAGYHRLELAVVGAGKTATATILSAPRKAWSPGADHKHHGLFIPLHALQSERSLGVGDFTDLGDLADWARGHGGSVVGTLPLLASFLDEPCDPSPYTPCSRLAWNELYLDLESIPEYADSARARAKLEDPEGRAAIARLRAMPLVDHRAEMALRRAPLEIMAAELFERGGPRRAALEAFAIARPEIVDYARFRSALERHRLPWDRWPEAARAGTLSTADIDAAAFRYHLYVQFCCDEQLARLSQRTAGGGLGLYLDLPVGVHGAGYDTWRERDAFVHGLATGAPPDLLFAGGQNWAFPPLHPEHIRRGGHRYPIAMIRNHLRYAKVLRIDHVMGLHRLYVIPQGASAKDGIYLGYPHEELYAILSIESHRSHTLLVGEDLGTVPPEVHHAMAEHGICGMHVVEYAAKPFGRALPQARRDQVASVNTHDMPTFRAYWDGLDIDDKLELGWLDARTAADARRERAQLRGNLRALWAERSPLAPDADAELAYDACLTDLGESDAVLTIVALEDLWGEVHPHNVPGTWLERPNWRRRARLDLGTLARDPHVAARMRRLDRARRGAAAGGKVRYDVSPITADDEHWFNEGTHETLQRKLGAHPMVVDDVAGTHFAVWAPSAESVTVIGDFNGWDRERHPLRPRGSSGIWEGFVPGVGPADRYKFHVRGHGSAEDKADPVALWSECPPRTASLVAAPEHRWRDEHWMATRAARNRLDAPISIYEVHLGSWMRVPEEGGRVLGYRELGPKLAAYCNKLGFTHVELLPVMEHPFYGSWGYQTTGYFAPSARYGGPADFMAMVDTLHQAGIAVILDWVPSHFPGDGHGLAKFDGTHLYEHDDPRKGFHPDWQSLIFNYGRYEVCSFLISSALTWLSDFHVDGLRVDAVASMLYLDYSRKHGEWVPNRYGGRENLEAIALLRRLNEAIFRQHPDVQTFAEESTAWPMVSRPTWLGGLGFGFKWDMGWMHDMLQYMARDPIHRGWHQHELTFRMIYAFTENYVLPLSHDEVVHGKGSLLGKMPGDRWQQFANLRLLYGAMWGQPGKKLLFMGGEFGQIREWNHDLSLDWHLLSDPMHAGVSAWITDLNRLLREQPALHELDVESGGYEWVDFSDATNSVLAWLRRARDGSCVLVVCNFTPVPRHDYRIGVPEPGEWVELANSDAAIYGGSGVGNWGAVWSEPHPSHDRPHSLRVSLPPLSASFFARRRP